MRMNVIGAFFVSLIFGRLTIVFGDLGVERNLTAFAQHRAKRGLIFENGGVIKLVIGPTLPVQFADPIVWRSLICSYNIHVSQFKILDKPFYPWDKWEYLYARSQNTALDIQPDSSREVMYEAIEYFLNRTHGNGRECLLRLICENAQVDHHMDMFGEILNVILTPGKEKLESVYPEAYRMGKSGIDCLSYYRKCPKGFNFFDQFFEEE